MNEFYSKGSFTMPNEWLTETRFQLSSVSDHPLLTECNNRKIIDSASVNHQEIEETMRNEWKQHKYLVDPHTAIGIAALYKVNFTISLPY